MSLTLATQLGHKHRKAIRTRMEYHHPTHPMSTKLNAEELAANRYPSTPALAGLVPMPGIINGSPRRESYATAIREVAQPIAYQRDELLELIKMMDEHEGAEGWSSWLRVRIDAAIAKCTTP